MYPYLLPNIFGYNIPMYDLMVALGVIALLLFVSRRFDNQHGFTKKQTNSLLIIILVSLLAALVSSLLFDTLFHSLKEGKFTIGTLTFIGALIGGVTTFLLLVKYFFKIENKNTREILNTFITGVVLAHAIGRIGCFLAGCCYGVPTDSFIGVVFPHGLAHEKFPNTALYPTQLFEAIFLFILFFSLIGVKKIKGKELPVYLTIYGLGRLIIELFRGDDRGILLPFITTKYNSFPTPSQYLSLIMFVLGVVLLVKDLKYKEAK